MMLYNERFINTNIEARVVDLIQYVCGLFWLF